MGRCPREGVIPMSMIITPKRPNERPSDEEIAQLAEARFLRCFADERSEELINEGPWAGFTRGEALAWCRNLLDYEPQGFILPKSAVRQWACTEVAAGRVPHVFGYAERAQQLASRGMSAREYRVLRQFADDPIFHPADVKATGGADNDGGMPAYFCFRGTSS